jgi:acetyltransferase-like isoleucine patch superfamily enzyme
MVIFERIKFWQNADRIGPDIPINHYKLYFKTLGRKLCQKKFKYFGEGAEFRPGAYAIACSKISIGKRVVIRPSTMLFAETLDAGGEITIEDEVLIGSGVHIYTTNHRFNDPNQLIINQGSNVADVILEKGCWLGANVIV